MKLNAMMALIAVSLALVAGTVETFGIIDSTKYTMPITVVLVVAGVLIGLMNISDVESQPFMIAVLVIGGGAVALANIPMVGRHVQDIFARIATLVIPAGTIVALKVAWNKIK